MVGGSWPERVKSLPIGIHSRPKAVGNSVAKLLDARPQRKVGGTS